jgi:DNA (cytosine-5)-methyltransferase 1
MEAASLFSGIGGIELGFERAGMTTAWQCEIDKDARAVLAEHWPTTECFPDVKEIDDNAARVDVLCGGFPCQDVSVAGNRAGLAGERSGLFHEFKVSGLGDES